MTGPAQNTAYDRDGTPADSTRAFVEARSFA